MYPPPITSSSIPHFFTNFPSFNNFDNFQETAGGGEGWRNNGWGSEEIMGGGVKKQLLGRVIKGEIVNYKL